MNIDPREVVFVTGHRNPDMDSVCSAWAYARLKNLTDPTRRYIAIRGHMNDITKAQFARLQVEAPMYVHDLRPRIADITNPKPLQLQEDDPMLQLCNLFKTPTISNVTVFSGRTYKGMLSVDDITRYFLSVSSVSRPVLKFSCDNFPKVMKGRFIKVGQVKEFEAAITVGMMKLERFELHLRKHRMHPPLCVISERTKHIELAVKMGVPCIVLTGIDNWNKVMPLLEGYEGTVWFSEVCTDETIQMLRMSIAIKHLMSEKQPDPFSPQDYYDDVKPIIMKAEFRAYPVISDGQFKGIITRRDFLARPRKKVIMMDHNELTQTIEGLEDAEIMEIIDHHRFAPQKTQKPIFIDAEPLGSTCSLVYGLYRRNEVDLDQITAQVLLSGLISDTVMLKSPTTTQRDKEIAHKLAQVAKIKDLKLFGETMFSGGASITTQEPRKLITADFKCFDEAGVKFGIGQCEVATFQGVDEVRTKWLDVLNEVKQENGLEWAMVVITNIIQEDSIMLTTPHQLEENLSYKKMSDGQYFCPGVLSRKIQVLPEIIRVVSGET